MIKKYFSYILVTILATISGFALQEETEKALSFSRSNGLDTYYQTYAYCNVSEKSTLTLGRWNIFLGYELIAHISNFNYGSSFVFSQNLVSNMQLKVDFALSEDFSSTLVDTNPWDTNNTSVTCLLYTSPSPRDRQKSRMPSSA